MKNNNHSKAFDEHVLIEIENHLDELLEAVKPYATPLTSKTKKNLFKMGEKSHAFVAKSFEFANKYPDMVPAFIDMTEYADDHQDANGLFAISNKAKLLSDMLDDIKTTAGSDALQASLAFYNHLGLLVKQNIPGAKTIREELMKRFPRKTRASEAVSNDENTGLHIAN
jgi:hypothetical protein